MRKETPTTHAELLAAFVTAKRSVIAEFSGDTKAEIVRLRKWSEGYAAANGLPNLADWTNYEFYFEPEEQ